MLSSLTLKSFQVSPRRRQFSLGRYGECAAVGNAIAGDSDVIKARRTIRETDTDTPGLKVWKISKAFTVSGNMKFCRHHHLFIINPEGEDIAFSP